MKKILIVFSLLLSIALLLTNQSRVLADGEEVKRGEDIWQKISVGQLQCENLTEGEFENLGEFFMERMTGSPDSHEVMDKQMEQMMGKESLEQMHIAMGKRMSGCQVGATPGANGAMMNFNMMNMMMQRGGERFMMGPGMMGWGTGPAGWGVMGSGTFWVWSLLSWVTWILVIVALVAFIRWMWKKGDKK